MKSSLSGKILSAFNYLFENQCGIPLDSFFRITGADSEEATIIIEKLNELGIADIRNGIINLKRSENDIFPDAFNDLEGRYFYYPEVGSTMDVAGRHAADGCQDFTVVVAESQISGRGRLGRQWVSDSGGIYCSIVLRPDIPPESAYLINFLVSGVLVSLLRSRYGIKAFCKWPNDILAGSGKLAGMIADSSIEGQRLRHLIVGIGINVNNVLSEVGQPASSMAGILGSVVPRRRFLRDFISAIEKAYAAFGTMDWIAVTRKYSATIGKVVRIEKTSGSISGRAIDIGADGSLIVRLDDTSLVSVSFGDCLHSFV